MFSFFFSRNNDSDNDSRSLFNQNDLLAAHGQSSEQGLCAPLSNLHAKYELGLESDKFLKDPNEAYKRAAEEENHQLYLEKQGEDWKHSALVDAHVPYETKEVPTKEITSKDGLDKLISEPSDALITYPVKQDQNGNVTSHMISIGREGLDKCYYYNPNNYISHIDGPCNKIIPYAAGQIEKEALHDSKSTDASTSTIAIAPRRSFR